LHAYWLSRFNHSLSCHLTSFPDHFHQNLSYSLHSYFKISIDIAFVHGLFQICNSSKILAISWVIIIDRGEKSLCWASARFPNERKMKFGSNWSIANDNDGISPKKKQLGICAGTPRQSPNCQNFGNFLDHWFRMSRNKRMKICLENLYYQLKSNHIGQK
jgi:hypothetical protein